MFGIVVIVAFGLIMGSVSFMIEHFEESHFEMISLVAVNSVVNKDC
jgi:hypothetical protein